METRSPLKVFISSTYQDLANYRSAVMEVLQGFEFVFKGMEYFGASENTPLDVCLNNVKQSDLVICILGTRYGSCPPNSDKSYTHLEVEYAIENQKPVYVYMIDEEHQPILAKFVDMGEKRKRLMAFKRMLNDGRRIVESFTTPEELGRKLARDLFKGLPPISQELKARKYRECAYDLLAEWYDLWYKGHWCSNNPCNTIISIVGSYLEHRRGNLSGLKILDCACGTGNTFVAFARLGMEIYGTDGSREMLLRAKVNCESIRMSTERLILDPINWTDFAGYQRYFKKEFFDLIVNTANSLCHIPPTNEYLHTALSNFYKLLKPGGLLLVDTKKYIRSDPANDVPTYKELRYDASEKEWFERFERTEIEEIEGYGKVTFHTRLVYDIDPSFNPAIRRALIIITIFGENLALRTLVVPYYPLPASILKNEMGKVGFKPTIFPAFEGLARDWKYDIVVGQKPGPKGFSSSLE